MTNRQTDRQTDPSLHRQQEVVHATRSNTQFTPPDPTQQGSFFSRPVGRCELATREGKSEEALLLTSSRNAAVYRPWRRQAERSGPLRAGCRRCTSPPPSVPAAAPCQRRYCRHRKRKSSREKKDKADVRRFVRNLHAALVNDRARQKTTSSAPSKLARRTVAPPTGNSQYWAV